MQNPFRHHGPDDRDHERDERRWEARDQRFDESRSWGYGGGDGGRSAEAYADRLRDEERYRAQSRGQWSPGPRERGYSQPTYSADYAPRDDWYGQAAPRHDEARRDYSRRDFGSSSEYRRPQDYRSGPNQYYGGREEHGFTTQGYAPGAQIWEGSDRAFEQRQRAYARHDYEPDYLHWRAEQLENLDRDYDAWRHERRQKFSSDFDTWRQNRPRTEASGTHHTPAANPIVGDVSDGGVGTQHDAKKR